MLILKEAFNGTRRFSRFQRELNIPRQTLSLRLAHLCQEQMLFRRFVGPSLATLEYVPTPKAFDLHDAMYSVWLWHEAHPSDVDVLPFDVIHTPCGHRLTDNYCCRACEQPVKSTSVRIERSQPEQFETEPRSRLPRRNDTAITAAEGGSPSSIIAASIVGDLPSNEILYLLFQGQRHLLAIVDALQIGLPVVRDRLDRLRDLGLISETNDGRRLNFEILPRAEVFYTLLISIATWGDRWCNNGQPPPELRIHQCGSLLDARFRCAHCGEWIHPHAVMIAPRHATG